MGCLKDECAVDPVEGREHRLKWTLPGRARSLKLKKSAYALDQRETSGSVSPWLKRIKVFAGGGLQGKEAFISSISHPMLVKRIRRREMNETHEMK